MQQRTLFEYAVIRVMPRVDREEFLNIGIILYCAKQKYLKMLYVLDEHRLQAFDGYLDMDELKEHLCSFERICSGNLHGGPIAKLDIPSRFRWLTAAYMVFMAPTTPPIAMINVRIPPRLLITPAINFDCFS